MQKNYNHANYNLAIVGATGNVGHEILAILNERKFPVAKCVALASSKSVGKQVSFGEKNLTVKNLEHFDFADTDIVLSSAGGKISADFAPRAAKANAVIIDNTSHFRMHKSVPLIIPEINPQAIKKYRTSNIIANPNCSTIQMLMALKPLHDEARIKRISVATYQSVSGSGKAAMDELFTQVRAILVNDPVEHNVFQAPIAFNCIPHIDSFMPDGNTKEEWKMVVETHKILDPDIKVTVTCVRVPVFIGHAVAVNVEFANPLSPAKARSLLNSAPGVTVIDRNNSYATQSDCPGSDAVFVSRIRKDDTLENGLNLWVVSDNLRKGAALNAVQIAELLVAEGGLHPKSENVLIANERGN